MNTEAGMDTKMSAAGIMPIVLAVGTPAAASPPAQTILVGIPLSAATVEQTSAPPVNRQTAQSKSALKKWEFTTIGYVWFAGAQGKTTPRDPLPPVDLNLSFGDVLKAFKFAFMGAAEARKDHLVLIGDLMWVHLGEGKGLTVRDRSFASVKIDSKTTAITALAGYRIVDNDRLFIDVLAGGRLNGNKQEVDYHGTLNDVSRSVSKTWIDPVVATRISAPLGGKFRLSIYGDVGGFGIGSKLTWQSSATANYQINHKMTAGLAGAI
jgi:hypothetical protein